MAGTQQAWTWAAWAAGSLLFAGWLAWAFWVPQGPTLFMPGELTRGHHQFADKCSVCHTSPLGGTEVLETACLDCHGDVRKKPFDSHPRAKFKDPRNADRLVHIDALHCTTCHREHRPEITLANGLTQPKDLCFHCHAEVAEERPSHAGMAFNTCSAAGCHNFHDNRALYTNFLVKHVDEPALLASPQIPERQFGELFATLEDYPLHRFPAQPLTLAQVRFPEGQGGDDALQADWLASAHARAGVGCQGCHRTPDADGQQDAWQDKPGQAACAQCHATETRAFGKGLHGMRPAVGLPPMTPAQARLPMRPEAAHQTVSCVSCHAAHRFDTLRAAGQACLQCHADEHSLAWEDSPHGKLWLAEQAGEAPGGSGVSCATCHMPREEQQISDWMSRIVVEHNQSAVLSPNSRMLRPVCLHCHGMGFSLDALADRALIANNFRGEPRVHVETMELARAEKARRERERAASGEDDTSMFGF